MPLDYNPIITAIGSTTTTLVVAYCSARLAIHRAYQERWWTRKEQVYSEIIESPHDLLRYSSFEADEYANPSRAQNPKSEEFARRYVEAYWRVQKMTDIGPFVISQEASELLEKLRNRPKLDPEFDDPAEVREQESKDYREALDGIRKCAKRDLKI